jgi:hypothetical protein
MRMVQEPWRALRCVCLLFYWWSRERDCVHCRRARIPRSTRFKLCSVSIGQHVCGELEERAYIARLEAKNYAVRGLRRAVFRSLLCRPFLHCILLWLLHASNQLHGCAFRGVAEGFLLCSVHASCSFLLAAAPRPVHVTQCIVPALDRCCRGSGAVMGVEQLRQQGQITPGGGSWHGA